MNEQFLQHIWKYNLWQQHNAKLSTGENVSIVNPGIHNFDSGPDFTNARIKVGEEIWAGNVEVHIKSSDWYLHNHQSDKAYDNVLVHVVYKHDKDIVTSSGRIIPALEIRFDEKLLIKYEQLINSERWIACEESLTSIEPMIIRHFVTSLTIRRLERKTEQLDLLYNESNNDFAQTLFISLAKSLGTKLNALPFELLAKSIPINILIKHKDELFIIEALLFGMAGMLDENDVDEDYYLSLKKEFAFQKHKYKLKPIEKHLWKFLRIRPQNFPSVRLAQLSLWLTNHVHKISEVVNIVEHSQLKDFFNVATSPYWETHYRFGVQSRNEKKNLGHESVDLILINSVIPFIFAYGKWKGDEMYCNRAIALLENINAEKNKIIENWSKRKVVAENAYESQGLIELKNEFCTKKRCLDCVIGNRLIIDERKR